MGRSDCWRRYGRAFAACGMVFVCSVRVADAEPAVGSPSAAPVVNRASDSPAGREARVLFLHSHGPDDAYTKLQIKGMMDALSARVDGAVWAYHEYLFLSMGSSEPYHISLRSLLRERYAAVKIDLVAITDTRAMEFWIDDLQADLPGVPVVFSGSHRWFPEFDDPNRRMTGAMERVDVRASIEFVRRVLPGTRTIAVMSTDTVFGRRVSAHIEDVLRDWVPGVDVRVYRPHYLEDVLRPFETDAPPDALIFVTGPHYVGPRGRPFAPEWLQKRVPGGVPCFSLFEGGMGPGSIGGVISSGVEMGRIAGNAAVRMLFDGVSAASIPIDRGEGSIRTIASWPELKRWKIDEDLLPAGTTIVDRPESFWIRHERTLFVSGIVAAATLATIMGAVTWGLLVNRRRRQRAEQELKESERRLHHALQAADLGTWECDIATGHIIGSDRFCDLYGIERGVPFLKSDGLRRVHPDDAEKIGRAWAECIEGSGQYRTRYRFLFPDGTYRWFKVDGGVVKNAAGENLKVVGVSADITEEHNAALQLAESEERLRLMAENLGEAFWLAEPDGWTFRYASKAFEALWGRPRSAISGHARETLLGWIHPDDRGWMRERCLLRPEHAAGDEMENQFRVVHPDGTLKWISCSSRPVRDQSGQIRCFVGVHRDITEKMQSRLALMESERRLAELIHNAPLAIIEWDDQWRCTRWDGTAETMFGWRADEVIGLRHDGWKFIHEEDAAAVTKAISEHEARRSATFRCTNRHYTKSGEVRICEWTKANKYDSNGRRLSTLSMVSDVTDRERTRELLQRSEERYRLAVRTATDIIWDWDVVTGRIEWSDAAQVLPKGSGPASSLSISEWIDHLHPDDRERVRQSFFAALNRPDAEVWEDEYRHALEDGSYAHFTDRALIIRDSEGRAVRMVGAMTDISERREADARRRETEERLRELAAASDQYFWVRSLKTNEYIYRSPSITKMLGISEAEAPRTLEDVYRLIHPDDLEAVRSNVRAWEGAGCTGGNVLEFRVIRPDGSVRWWRSTAYPGPCDEQGCVDRLLGVAEDITRERQMLNSLKEGEQRLASLIDNSPLAIIEWDHEFRCARWSGAAERIFGWAAGEVVGKQFRDWRFVHEDDVSRVRDVIAGLNLSKPEHVSTLNRNYTKDGRVITCEWNNTNLYDESGRRVRTISLAADVTEREEARLALAQSEEKFRRLAETIDEVFWVAKPSRPGGITYVSPAVKRVYGMTEAEVYATPEGWTFAIHPEDRPGAIEAAEAWARSGFVGTYSRKYRVVHPDGRIRMVHNRGYGFRGPDGSVTSLVGSSEDVTEREESQLQLRDSEKRFREIAENIPQVFWTADPKPDGLLRYVSPAAIDVFGKPASEFEGTPFGWASLIHPDDIENADRVRVSWHGGGCIGVYENHYRIVHPDGGVRLIQNRGYAVRGDDNQIVRIAGLAEDVTEREAARALLAESERKFRLIAENIDQVFWTRSLDTGEVLYISPATERLWGIAPDDVTGPVLTWRNMIHPDDRARVVADIERWVQSGAKGEYRNTYRIVLKNGAERWVTNRGSAIADEHGRPWRMVGVTEDITDAKLASDELARTLQTRQLLLTELDHRVKNALAGLLSLVEMCSKSERTVEGFAAAVNRRVCAMAGVHAMLSASRWAPIDLSALAEGIGPPDAPGTFEAIGPAVEVTPRQATPLGSILQELFSNSLKYGALGARGGQVRISWHVTHTELESPQLSVEWVETGGPEITELPTEGLGTSLILGFARFELRGEAILRFPRSGAHHTLRVGLERAGQSQGVTTDPDGVERTSLDQVMAEIKLNS